MRITHLHIKNFRCFESFDLTLDSPLIVIEGTNGSGKTSVLEALHYLCYLRSFRTHMPNELVHFGKENFFIKATLAHDEEYTLQVGFSNKKKLVKMNERAISSFKDLLDYYRIITLTEDDIQLIKEGPELRRFFLDQALVLQDPTTTTALKRNRDIVENRNALLRRGGSSESYQLWTGQLWESSCQVQALRQEFLTQLQEQVHALIEQYFPAPSAITLTYMPKKELQESLPDFMATYPDLYERELHMGRSLFGAHLDDIAIQFRDARSRSFASRGQQKLIIVLLKIAQLRLLKATKGSSILLLDDFMTDFDQEKAKTLFSILQELGVQLIFTLPTTQGSFWSYLLDQGALHIRLPN